MLNFIVAVSIIIAVWAVFFARLVVRERYGDSGAKAGYIVIPCTENVENLEHIVKSDYWDEIFRSDKYSRKILLVQMGENKNLQLSRELEKEYSIVECVDISDLEEYISAVEKRI